MYQSDISKLAEDISLKGLNPNELPVIIPGPDDDNKYLVMDGNRRITSIKLMTQYKDRLEELGLSPASRRFFQNLQCDIKVVTCVLFEKEDRRVNDLLEKLHTSKPGISQKKWDPQAQDRHQFKNGGITKRLAIIEMLRSSDYTSSEARNALNQGGWTSKLKRFAEYEASFFGIGFDKENNIILFLEEKEVMKGLSQLVIDLMAQVGFLKGYSVQQERESLMAAAFGRLSLANSRRWIRFMQTILPQIQLGKGALLHPLTMLERSMLMMVYYTIWGKGLGDLGNRFSSIEEGLYWAIND